MGQQTQDVDRPVRSIRKPVREKGGEEALLDTSIGLKIGPREAPPSSGTVRNTDRAAARHRFENRTDIGSNSEPGSVRKEVRERFDNRTAIEITEEITPNNNSKGAADGFEQLLEVGFDATVARRLADGFDSERIAKQIHYLPARNAMKNRLGMLRRAIEEDWLPPLPPHSPKAETPNRESAADIEKAYQQFIQSEAMALKTTDPSLWAAFEKQEQTLRTTLQESPMISASVRQRIVGEFDGAGRQENRWIEFAIAKRKLPSLAQWQSWTAERRENAVTR